jgi:TPR repeat protein
MPLTGFSMRTLWFIVLTVVSFCMLGGPASADKRIALIIGNSAYENVTRLDNPKNDAALMADTMRGLGFTLVGNGPQVDLDKAGLDRAVQNFGQLIQGADVALFYYAGHGVQVNGSNYLVPVNANPTREADVDFQMVDVNVVLRQMQGSGTRLNLVVLDACRNNPFGNRGLRATDGGLAQMRAPEGTLISYATQPGSVAQDGADGHSPYTKALANTVRRAGLDIFQTFNQVGLTVKRATGGSQQPWVSSSPIDGEFYFVPPTGSAAVSHQPDAPAQDAPPAKSRPDEPADARRSLEKAANTGDTNAMVNLGFMYERGNGVPRSLAEAVNWYGKAAAGGNTYGMRNLGTLYRDGNGVAKSVTEARKWFEKAVAGGNVEAMNSLGLLYQTGIDGPPNYAEARKWFEKAVSGGNSDAMNSLGFLYETGMGAPPNYTEARKWFEKGVAAGNVHAMVNLGYLYDKGYGVAQNYSEALKWYEKGAAGGEAVGMKNAGIFYRDGFGVAKDPAEARSWFEKAAAAGNGDAMTSLGFLYETGNGVPKDYVEARKWYEKSVVAGSAIGMTNLGMLYRDGRGVAQDKSEARSWFEKAAATGYDRARIALQELNSPRQGTRR